MKRKEAYLLIIDGCKYYFTFDYAGWRAACNFVVNVLGFKNTNFPLKKVYIGYNKSFMN